MTKLFKKKVKENYGMICDIEFKTAHAKIVHALFLLVAIILSAVCILPIIWLVLSAFKGTKEFMAIPPSFLPEKIELQKFVDVWVETDFAKLYFNTILMAGGKVIFSVVCSGLAGYVVSRLKPRGCHFIFMLILWTMLLPHNVSQVPLFMTFTDFPITGWNLSNTLWPMWLTAGANCYYILLFKSYFDSLSISYFESAKIDGCSNLKMFFKIVVPLSIPVIAVITIFQFNGAWGEYFWPMLLLNDGRFTVIGQRMMSLKNQMAIDRYVMAMIIVIIPPSIMYLIFQKQIMGGLTVGGVKG